MDCLDAIRSRRSSRSYAPGEISAEEEGLLLEAAMCAPSAHGSRPWRFLVVRDKAGLEGIAERHPYAKMCSRAAMAVLVCADLAASKEPAFWQQDCGAATENILLAAESLGIGAVWISGHPKGERTGPIKALFGIPENIELFCVVALGRLVPRAGAAPRYDESFVRRGKWS